MAAISPDGSELVYAVESAAGRHLIARNLRTRDVRALADTDGAASPFFSPDGSRLGFWKGGALRAMNRDDGSTVLLADAMAPFGASWRSNGDLVFTSTYRSGLFLSHTGGGSRVVRPLTIPAAENREVSHRWPDALPNSRFVLFSVIRDAGDPQVVALDISSGVRHLVVENSTRAQFAAPDHLLFARGRRLMVARFDPPTARIVGDAVEVADDLAFSPVSGLAQFTVSSTGVLAYLTKPAQIGRDLVLVDRSGHVTRLPAPARPYIHPRVSPDGRQIAMWQEIDDTADIWTYKGAMYAVPVAAVASTIQVGTSTALFADDFEKRPAPRANYDVMPDGRFLMLRRHERSATQHIILSLNWSTQTATVARSTSESKVR
jgi:Tol biopolymer transport system component